MVGASAAAWEEDSVEEVVVASAGDSGAAEEVSKAVEGASTLEEDSMGHLDRASMAPPAEVSVVTVEALGATAAVSTTEEGTGAVTEGASEEASGKHIFTIGGLESDTLAVVESASRTEAQRVDHLPLGGAQASSAIMRAAVAGHLLMRPALHLLAGLAGRLTIGIPSGRGIRCTMALISCMNPDTSQCLDGSDNWAS